MLSLLTNLGGAQEEHNEADRRGVGSYLEMAKEVAAEAFEEGYAACLRKLAEAGANFSGWSFVNYFAGLEEEAFKGANPSDSAIPGFQLSGFNHL